MLTGGPFVGSILRVPGLSSFEKVQFFRFFRSNFVKYKSTNVLSLNFLYSYAVRFFFHTPQLLKF